MSQSTKQFWEKVNTDYKGAWVSKPKLMLSEKETGFINKYSSSVNAKTILDVGLGTGRIIENHIAQGISTIYGVDISNKLVDFCKAKYKEVPAVKSLVQSDISKDDIPFNVKFDLITAIRVLQYNENWPEIIAKLTRSLDDKGVMIISMLNNNSINRFNKPQYKASRSTPAEIMSVLKDLDLQILEMQTFTRLPDALYDLFDNALYAKILSAAEKLISLTLGKVFLGRILFISIKKNS